MVSHLVVSQNTSDAIQRKKSPLACDLQATSNTYFRVMLPGNERKELNYGGKIILPASALEKLTRMHIEYPMMFELVNGKKQTMTHAGVLEFVAEEGKAYLPHWVCSHVCKSGIC